MRKFRVPIWVEIPAMTVESAVKKANTLEWILVDNKRVANVAVQFTIEKDVVEIKQST